MTLLPLLYAGNTTVCALLTLHLVGSRNAPRRSAIATLALNYAMATVQSLLSIIHLLDPGVLPQAARPALALLLGPALITYFRRIRGVRLSFMDFFQLLPAALVVALFIAHSPWLRYVDSIILGSFAAYFVWGVRCLRGGPASLHQQGSNAPAAFRWLRLLVTLMALNLVVEIGITREISQGTPLHASGMLLAGIGLFLSVNAATLLGMLRQSTWLQWMFQAGDQLLKGAQKPKLDEATARALFQRWEQRVEQEKLHLQEAGITLPQAARKLGIPARDLSFAINFVSGDSFSRYLNHCRVNTAIRLLEQGADNMTEVMLASGFHSKSHFNKEFLRVTGVSPSLYRQSKIPGGAH